MEEGTKMNRELRRRVSISMFWQLPTVIVMTKVLPIWYISEARGRD